MKDWLLCRRSRCKSGQKEHGTFKTRMPCSFFAGLYRMDNHTVQPNPYNESRKVDRNIRQKEKGVWKNFWWCCWALHLCWILRLWLGWLADMVRHAGRFTPSQMNWWTAPIASKEVGNLRIVYLDFLGDGQAICPSFFVYWGCAKETKFFCNSVKRQKFIQRIAGIVVLCYNEQRRRINRA